MKRWKEHCKNATNNVKSKLYNEMNKHGIENCRVEIVEDNFDSVAKLALAEIKYIKIFDTYLKGLNSTCGGDGIGRHDLYKLNEKDILVIKEELGINFSNYNKNVKWAGTTKSDRQAMTQHLHTNEIYEKKSNTLKKFYERNPEEKHKKGKSIKSWQLENQELMKDNNRKNSLIGAEKVSKKLLVEFPDGRMLKYPSKSEFLRQTGQWANTIIAKTNKGSSHNGYKVWEIND
jgi:endo-1,4-beta-mannosidase